jgi:hypothetical protein
MKQYKVVIEACDGQSILAKGLSEEDAKKRASKWLGRKMIGNYDVSDHGSAIYVLRYVSDVADPVWEAIGYLRRHTFEELSENRKTDKIVERYLEGLSDDDIKQGLQELRDAGFIDKLENTDAVTDAP